MGMNWTSNATQLRTVHYVERIFLNESFYNKVIEEMVMSKFDIEKIKCYLLAKLDTMYISFEANKPKYACLRR